MDGNQLFTMMFKDDHEGQKLLAVPGADESMQQFEQRFVAIVRTMFDAGLKVDLNDMTQRERERNVFRKKNYVIEKSKIFGYVLKKPKRRIHDELQHWSMNSKFIKRNFLLKKMLNNKECHRLLPLNMMKH